MLNEMNDDDKVCIFIAQVYFWNISPDACPRALILIFFMLQNNRRVQDTGLQMAWRRKRLAQ